ncbi:unnamed protein product [Lupinus luteus]|uniref:SBP-type domain-containing protein n=1 Tax=Lupinus luteus TaxID=3873 RepID=A0AAV1X1W1_LUPLU
MNFSLNAFMRSRKTLVEWDNKASCNFDKDGFTSDREIDLKLGRLADCEGKSSDIHPTTPAKRCHTSVLPIQAHVCQVYGCNMDLSSSKDYHIRHSVCDVHSKTAKVIVNGIEQRFCQQCSRFHFLADFDDGKRNCRRRLAGHYERRKKPQFGYTSDNQHKIFQFQGMKNQFC